MYPTNVRGRRRRSDSLCLDMASGQATDGRGQPSSCSSRAPRRSRSTRRRARPSGLSTSPSLSAQCGSWTPQPVRRTPRTLETHSRATRWLALLQADCFGWHVAFTGACTNNHASRSHPEASVSTFLGPGYSIASKEIL